ncbi:cilia- and flagella-associated protein 44 [Anthonomus grandis grandis]|uniref:cilia- and flagella-associated protein 44 n=1 Tax=Anthonomus grandis grandis TaxID=2921223 RepID=UPI002165C0C4|nr:cilia- and flagella-associated protein 44 [Anthonomus grandis grandis]
MSDTEGEAENIPEDTETEEGTTTYGTSEYLGEEEETDEGSVYDPDDFISGPSLSENGTLGLDILEFDHSHGYDCRKFFNLTVLDENSLVFSSGNFINFFDVPKREITFRRSALGGGIGHIRKNGNPIYPYFAVAECGTNPIIIMYVWPSLDIVCVLREGAERTFTNMDFNPDGDLLVSQSGEPDYLITVWDWRNHSILLRTKSYVNDVFRVKFSPYVAGEITTCGIAHIKFWKMASTFTGLKLKGELGRFGKTEYSDILGVLPMPDAKVVSGCSWGNILVWDDGLITFEVFRSLRRKCHDAPIVQFNYLEGELWTVSMDGHVKVWWFEKIDQADPPDDDRVILVDPTYDFYTPGVKLMSTEKRKPGDSSDTFWYAQDGNGGIWLIDLNTEEEPQPSEQLFVCHGGKITGLATCPFATYVATLGELGTFYLYNYVTKRRVLDHKFPAGGVSLLWIPLEIDQTGELLLAGFSDGQVRVLCINIPDNYTDSDITLNIPQVIKPHNKPVTAMSLNPQGTILVTAGEDCSIFVFKLNIPDHHQLLVPIGYFNTSDIVTCIAWHPHIINEVLVGCIHGEMMQIELPSEEQSYTSISFNLYLTARYNVFKSYKSQIKRDIKIREIEERKEKKVAKKRIEMEQIKKENPGLEIDEETFLADSESEEVLEPLFFPEVPNAIIWLKYTTRDTIWLSMAGYDAGYIYEYHIDQKDDVPVYFRQLDGANDMEVNTYIYTHNGEYLIFAMQDGSIRVNKVNPEDYTDLSDYFTISMHDNQNGFVPMLCFSYDEKYLFSCGHDGNIFAYRFSPKEYQYRRPMFRQKRDDHLCSSAHDVDTVTKLSLEEVKLKAEDDRIQKLANEHKNKIREILKNLKERYKKLMVRNSKLLPSQIIPREELEPDQRVADHVNKMFADKVEIVRKKLAYDVEKSKILVTKLQNYFLGSCDRHPVKVKGINNPECEILTVRQPKTPPCFDDMLRLVEQKLKEESGKGRPPERVQQTQKPMISKLDKSESPLEFFMLSLSPSVLEFRLGPKLTRLLKKYRKRRIKWKQRTKEWEDFLARKPVPGKNHPDDEKFLKEAKESFGDYKLKESPTYKVALEDRETTVKHYKKLLETRLKQFTIRHEFIEKVYDIRDYKYKLLDILKKKQMRVDEINSELPEEFRRNGPPIPEYDPNEFPEEKLQVKVVLPETESADTEDYEVMLSTQQIYVQKPNLDQLERFLLSSKGYPKFVDGFFQSSIPSEEVGRVADMTYEELISYPETVDTPFEACLRSIRMNRIYFALRLTLSEMDDLINEFNNRIIETRKERLPILIRGNFIDIYIVCVNEELQILKSSEEQEDKLSQAVNNKLSAVHELEDVEDYLKADKLNQEIKLENLKIEENKIQEKFKVAVENNKFYDFLKKVFKKKYKPPKVKTDDESSSSSSSSSDESDYGDDTGSIDSRDFGFIKQDLNVCPKGCDPVLYNFTVDLRSKRHELEQTEREEQRILELTKKEIEVAQRKMVILSRNYDQEREKLEQFRREKQTKLNTVKCTIVLTLDQIYCETDKITEDMLISNFLVFSRSKLTSLYNRVTLLHNDALTEQGKHDTYLKHLIRMKKDILYMKRKVKYLKKEIVSLLKIKFGKVVDINELESAVLQKNFQKSYVNELEEVVLKKLVYELRIKMTDVRGIYIDELKRWQRKIVTSQYRLAKEIKENTKRLELLAVISKEKKDIARFVDAQDKKRERIEHMETIHKGFVKDLEKLKDITNEQARTILDLNEEIKMLKTKGMAQEVRHHKERVAEYERLRAEEESRAEQEEQARHWVDYDEYVTSDAEEDEEEYEQVKKEISIPGYYSQESADLIHELLEQLLTDVDETVIKKSKEELVTSILSGILKCVSVHDYIQEIIDNLPIDELNEQQRSSIELVAERLFSINELTDSEDSMTRCTKEILNEILSEVMIHDPHYLIPKIVERLLDTLPVDFVASDASVDAIANSVHEIVSKAELDPEEFSKSLDRLPIADRQVIVDIMKSILEKVYGTGMDYLFVINKP